MITFHTEEGKTLLSSLAVACLKGEETSNYDARSKVLELAVPVQSPDVQQLQGVMLVSVRLLILQKHWQRWNREA